MHALFFRPALLVGLALCFTACDAARDRSDTLYGSAVALGNGTARTYVTVDAAGAPQAVGVLLTAGALDGLPTSGPMHEMMHTLPLHAEARSAGLPFDHVSLDWNPQGHEPDGLFTLPHFDVHFYLVSEASRMAWMPTDPAFGQKGMRLPAARYVPQGYLAPPGTAPVPMMGTHLVDAADPTYAPNGPGFSEVFIWGSYDGAIVFAEPMITRAMLQALATSGPHEEALAQPQAFARAGHYPTRYSIRYDRQRGEYRIELGGLTARTAS